jgi:DNA invertase Pin-like site-specific DNA recombinase
LTKTKVVAVYARVSTCNGQQDPEMQLRELRAYCERQNFVIYKEFIDYCSGGKDSRPQLNEMMKHAKQGHFDAVLVWRFDRFSRSLRHLINSIAELEHYGVGFISLKEAVDTSSPLGKVMLALIGSMAELERDLIRERVTAGIANARAKGITLGRPKKAQEIIAKAKTMHKNGAPFRAICREINISERTLRKYL